MSRYTVTFDDEYSVLHGPDGFECVLGEPEDRTWTRDGADVVARLETLETEIDRLHGLLRETQPMLGSLANHLDKLATNQADAARAHVVDLHSRIDAALSPSSESQVGGAQDSPRAESATNCTRPGVDGRTGVREPGADTLGTTSTSQVCPYCDHGWFKPLSGGRKRKCADCHGTGRKE